MSFPLGGERDSEGERKEAVRKMKVPKPRGVCLHRSYRGVRSALVVSPSDGSGEVCFGTSFVAPQPHPTTRLEDGRMNAICGIPHREDHTTSDPRATFPPPLEIRRST